MIVREVTEADFPAVRDLVAAYQDEFWRRPFPAPALPDEWLKEGRLLVAERDDEIAGVARGDLRHGLGRISFVYLRPEHRRHGLGSALVRDLLGFFREHGAEHVTLGVDTSNEEGAAVWRRLGFTEFSREMSADLDSLERRLGESSKGESYGSVHVQTDDQNAVAAAVERFLPRLFRSPATVVS
ncbi:MAG: GNAT family N-acetyltransferase, partial [Actinobacteria bacterium]|nr:GNAT family N-acetyltransferase [Actinomycetota bacterium]